MEENPVQEPAANPKEAVTTPQPEVTPAEPETTAPADEPSPELPTDKPSPIAKLKRLWHNKVLNHKKISIPVGIILILLIVLGIPASRYPVLGLAWKQDYKVKVLDSQTNQPVSAANVTLGGKTVTSDSQGNAHVKTKVGYTTLTISKKYYDGTTAKVLVPIKQKGAPVYKLKATGRQVPIKVINKITGKAVSNATIKAAGTAIHTDKNGVGTIVLPADKPSLDASLNAEGYNSTTAKIQVTTSVVTANTFQLTPAGKVYFLSDLSGKIDVVKTNLDGSDRQTVLAGSGFEDDHNTVLLASRDWKYLMLYSIRSSGSSPEINLIDTTNNDKMTNIDKGSNTSFELVGWQNDYFIYTVYRTNYKDWQPNASSLKSYNAQTGKLAILDNSGAAGGSQADAQFETYNTRSTFEINNQIIFTKTWYVSPGYLNVPGKQNTLTAINPDGSGRKTIASLDAGTSYFGNIVQYEPQDLIVEVSSNTYSQPAAYYEYKADGSYTKSTDTQASSKVQQNYPTYLLSPSGNRTFWSTTEDGKNGLYIGDQAGDNKTKIASLSDYSAFGWYSDNYLLVSKNASELYIMPANGGTAFKVTDYHKPDQNFYGYGGGYGGL